METQPCPLCNNQSTSSPVTHNHNITHCTCSNCGEFALPSAFQTMVSDNLHDPRLHALVRERSLHQGPVLLYLDNPAPSIEGYTPLQIGSVDHDFPTLISDRLDRALLNLAKLSPQLGTRVTVPMTAPAVLFAKSQAEAGYTIRALIQDALIESTIDSGGYAATLTPKGWSRVAELQSGRKRDPRNPAFVAMWFGNEKKPETPAFMGTVYEQQIRAAVESAGYRCTRVDLVEHNDFIMDQILGLIRQAPFVIADFTGNRGGVYLEAGFARGLGIPVIHTCRRAHFNRAHFDIKQINTINWKEPQDLFEPLRHRILATLGQGPFAGQPANEPSA